MQALLLYAKKMQNGLQWVPKLSKITKIIPKGCPKATTMHQKGSQNDQGTSKKEPCGKVSILDAKREDRQTSGTSVLGAFWLLFGPKSIKNSDKTSHKNRCRKSPEKHGNTS